MASKTFTGSGVITSTDFHTITYVGKTKNGTAVTITLSNAINLGDIDWAFAEKSDTVPQIVFTAAYTAATANVAAEPWTITIADDSITGADEIMLGVGTFSIDGTSVGLTRGGGSFKVTREYRRINADGDRGAVVGRVVCEASEATLTLNTLQFIKSVASLYPAIVTT